MNVADYLAQARTLGPDYQLAINALADEFRRLPEEGRRALVASPIAQGGWLEALLAAVVSYLCHEASIPQPSWVLGVTSPAPFFVLPARSFAMRVRLMLESPPPFRNRGVFVPENYLSRA
jgi:hypothetical protein